MKNINNNLNIRLKKYILIIIFLNKILFTQSVIGKKIKKEKQYNKEIIKNKIKNKITKIKSLNNKITNKTFNIDNLSSSARERYQLENYYIEGKIDNNYLFNTKNNNLIINYIKENYTFINNFFIENNILINQTNLSILLFFLNKYLSQGDRMREALNKTILQKSSFLNNYNNIFKLFNNIKKNNSNEYSFDKNIINIVNNILIFNASNKIEVERAINKFYNNSARKPVILIIEKYHKSSFNQKETNNTYGDLSPNKDIYKNLIYHPYFNDNDVNNKNNLFKRNFPEEQSIEHSFYLAIPTIKNNIVEYFIIEEKNNNIEIKKIEAIINNLNKNYFYSLLILSEKNISFIIQEPLDG